MQHLTLCAGLTLERNVNGEQVVLSQLFESVVEAHVCHHASHILVELRGASVLAGRQPHTLGALKQASRQVQVNLLLISPHQQVGLQQFDE